MFREVGYDVDGVVVRGDSDSTRSSLVGGEDMEIGSGSEVELML